MFKNAAQFSLFIEQMASEKRISHMDAVLKYCEENFIEPDEVKSLVNKTLKDKIEVDMREANLLPKQASLDV
jgi:KaiC/GvpD/RAD55 family RecA-like ATPase